MIPEFETVTIRHGKGTVTMSFMWGNYGWTTQGETIADCINNMVEYFTEGTR